MVSITSLKKQKKQENDEDGCDTMMGRYQVYIEVREMLKESTFGSQFAYKQYLNGHLIYM